VAAGVAQVSAALAGFAALAGLLGGGRLDKLVVSGVVETSLIALLFSLVPRLLSLRVAAFALLLVYTTVWVNAAQQSYAMARQGTAGHPLVSIFVFGVAIAGSGFSLSVALNVWAASNSRLYEAAVFCVVTNSCALLWLALRRFLYPSTAAFYGADAVKPSDSSR
jgi:hypothetical protein